MRSCSCWNLQSVMPWSQDCVNKVLIICVCTCQIRHLNKVNMLPYPACYFNHQIKRCLHLQSSWRWILKHECENTSLQNVELENVLSPTTLLCDIGNLSTQIGIFPCPYALKACLDFHIATMSIFINVIKNDVNKEFPKLDCSVARNCKCIPWSP